MVIAPNLATKIGYYNCSVTPLATFDMVCAQAAGAEVVVVFAGTSEFGGLFSTRQSYLPREVHWGYQFVQIVHRAEDGSSQHVVDIAR